MPRIAFITEFDGTDFAGFQSQENARAVQDVLEKALEELYKTKIRLTGCSRTDAGVHALRQYFHFDTEKEKDLKQLAYALNKMLPEDIKIISFEKVADDFHVRYNAKKKIYEYRIVLKDKDPFQDQLACIYPMELDFDLFKEALNKFVGKHNYQDFTSKEEDEGGFIREIYEVNVDKNGNEISVRFEGNGFMRYQIRNMIGAAISVANKKEKLDFIDYHLKEDKKREIISYKSPANGLYLVDVVY